MGTGAGTRASMGSWRGCRVRLVVVLVVSVVCCHPSTPIKPLTTHPGDYEAAWRAMMDGSFALPPLPFLSSTPTTANASVGGKKRPREQEEEDGRAAAGDDDDYDIRPKLLRARF